MVILYHKMYHKIEYSGNKIKKGHGLTNVSGGIGFTPTTPKNKYGEVIPLHCVQHTR